jgi:hypothetical protein
MKAFAIELWNSQTKEILDMLFISVLAFPLLTATSRAVPAIPLK